MFCLSCVFFKVQFLREVSSLENIVNFCVLRYVFCKGFGILGSNVSYDPRQVTTFFDRSSVSSEVKWTMCSPSTSSKSYYNLYISLELKHDVLGFAGAFVYLAEKRGA